MKLLMKNVVKLDESQELKLGTFESEEMEFLKNKR